MEKKNYTKPSIVKVKLDHKQAVLGTCSSTSPTGTSDGNTTSGYCKAHGCKQQTASGGIDSGASS
jgi:hypothetical protein